MGRGAESDRPAMTGNAKGGSRIVRYQIVAFLSLITLIWVGEVLDLPGLIWGVRTPVNWRESILETLFTAFVGTVCIIFSRHLLRRIRALEGLLPICARCKRIRDGKGVWHPMETYIGERSEVEFTHGLCPECSSELYSGSSGGGLPLREKGPQSSSR